MGLLEFLGSLNRAEHVASIQKVCGVEIVPHSPKTDNTSSHNGDINSENDKKHLRNGNLHHRNGYLRHETRIDEACVPNGYTQPTKVEQEKKTQNAYKDYEDFDIFNLMTNYCSKPKTQKNDNYIFEEYHYIIHYKLLYYLFLFAASLGNEKFYITFFPLCLWNYDSCIARRAYIVLWITMYIGQACKDVIQWDRPKSPPVARLEKRYETEFSMPSTHAMGGACIPFSMLLLSFGRYDLATGPWIAVAVFWCLLVAFSRLYLGMHTILDILAGLSLIAILNPLFLALVHSIDIYNITHPLAILTSPLIVGLLAWIYPSSRWSTAIGDTVTVVSVGAGMAMGSWLNWHLGYMSPVDAASSGIIPLVYPSFYMVCIGTVRFVVGMALLLATRAVIKPLSRSCAEKLIGSGANNNNSSNIQRTGRVEMSYKCVTYTLVAFNTTFTAPLIFWVLNIGRESYYNELLM